MPGWELNARMREVTHLLVLAAAKEAHRKKLVHVRHAVVLLQQTLQNLDRRVHGLVQLQQQLRRFKPATKAVLSCTRSKDETWQATGATLLT